MGGGPLGQSQSFFFLVMVGDGLGDLRVRGRTSGERRGFRWSGLFTHIFILLPPLERKDTDLRIADEAIPSILLGTKWNPSQFEGSTS